MSLKQGLLGLLNYTSATGYELKKAFDDSLNFFWNAHRSQIYKELTRMEQDKLLNVELVVQQDKPNKKVYSITELGRSCFMEWLKDDLDYGDFAVRESFLMKVFFWGELEQQEAVEKLESYIRIHEQKLASYAAIGDHISNYSSLAGDKKALFWSFTARHGFANSKTCIHWAKEARTMLLKGNENEEDPDY